MCAGSRYEESLRSDSLFDDPLAKELAGPEGLRNPMGAWILVPRTRYGDDLLQQFYYEKGCRQLVMLGAGVDARAFRMESVPELNVFEVDQQTTFDFKEPIVANYPLAVRSRAVVATDFSTNRDEEHWEKELLKQGFDKTVPTVWLLEGLVMYLTDAETKRAMRCIGRLSAKNSVVFHDAITRSYVSSGVVVGGARFVGGSDDYAGMWAREAGFGNTYVRKMDSMWVDRRHRMLKFDNRPWAEATPDQCRGQNLAVFVQSEKME
jgi:methyltransferase (TIGR00027 family)